MCVSYTWRTQYGTVRYYKVCIVLEIEYHGWMDGEGRKDMPDGVVAVYICVY